MKALPLLVLLLACASTPAAEAPLAPSCDEQPEKIARAEEILAGADAMMQGALTLATSECRGETQAECEACIQGKLNEELERQQIELVRSMALLEAAQKHAERKCDDEDRACLMREMDRFLEDKAKNP